MPRRLKKAEAYTTKNLALRRVWFAAERWSLGRAILVFFALFGALDGLFGWDDPVKTVLLFHFGEDEGLILCDERKDRAHEVGGVGGRGFLGFAFVDCGDDFSEARVGAAEAIDGGIAALNQGH